jgi:hypothetical protein
MGCDVECMVTELQETLTIHEPLSAILMKPLTQFVEFMYMSVYHKIRPSQYINQSFRQSKLYEAGCVKSCITYSQIAKITFLATSIHYRRVEI